MNLLDYFRRGRKKSAHRANERLRLIVMQDRDPSGAVPDFLPLLQKELLQVIRKYVDIDPKKIQVDVEQNEGMAMLEVNVELPGRQAS